MKNAMLKESTVMLTGKQLKRLRGLLGMGQHDMARLLGVSRVSISNWERVGDCGIPKNARQIVKERVDEEKIRQVSGECVVPERDRLIRDKISQIDLLLAEVKVLLKPQ